MNIFNKTASYKIGAAIILPLLLIAFAVQSLLPSGFMPVINKDGFTQIVICSGMEEKTIMVPNEGAPSEHQKTDATSKVCSFVTLASAIALPTLPPMTVPVDGASVSTVAFSSVIAPDIYHALPYPPRGPPAVNQI